MKNKIKNYLNAEHHFYYGDVLILLLMGITGLLIAKNNDSLIPVFSVEGILFFTLACPARKIILPIITITHAIRLMALMFGFFSIKVATLAAIQNFQNISLLQQQYIFSLFLALVFLTYVFLKIQGYYLFQIKNYILLILISILIPVSYFVERNCLTSSNLIGSELMYAKYVLAENVNDNGYKEIFNKNFKNSLKKDGNGNQYLFLIESFGVFESKKANDYLYSIFQSNNINNLKYFLTERTNGGTVGGEIRELCSKEINHSLIVSNFLKASECAANILKEKKYTSIAIHGGSRSIFNRPYIYKNIGFDYYFSGENFRKYTNCGGGWPSAPCDLDIIPELNEITKSYPEPKFVYYLTINTHYPYKLTRNDTGLVCLNYDIHDDLTCTHFINLANTLRSIQKLSLKTNGSFYLVGDHPPPLLWNRKDSKFVSTIQFNSTN